MFKIYHSNDLDVQKDILCHLLAQENQQDPFIAETILVQSPSMAQWLQLEIAKKNGIAANLHFPMPASFIWQQYVDNLSNVAEKSPFSKEAISWRLMRLFKQNDFQLVQDYLNDSEQAEQKKSYQLAVKIADLFDQYLVYRPHWIEAWEIAKDDLIVNEILSQHSERQEHFKQQITQDVHWQGQLWRALIQDIEQDQQQFAQHRAKLHHQYLQLSHYHNLPKRVFIFGISALPKTYLETFAKISQQIDVHLFFNNPCQYYWGDIVDMQFAQKLLLKKLTEYKTDIGASLLTDQQFAYFNEGKQELTAENEHLLIGNPLLSTWGKLGRDFFYLLSQLNSQDIQANTELMGNSLLTQVKKQILDLSPSRSNSLHRIEQDNSISIHACHSPMREVEVLHDYLLECFQKDKDLMPKDIVVMIADIDRYTPYIQAVFGQYQQRKYYDEKNACWQYDKRYVPFSISDERLSETDILLASFLQLLALKESQFDAESVLSFLEVPAIRARFQIELEDLDTIRKWVEQSGIRVGLDKNQQSHYNSWQAGLERLLLGFAMSEQNGLWQQQYLGFDNSYGLRSQLVGHLSAFIQELRDWHYLLLQSHSIQQWQKILTALLTNFFLEERATEITHYINSKIDELVELLQEVHFEELLSIDVIADVLSQKLNEQQQSLKFLAGSVNFCTLLPMRSIPFKIVCLLGMNEQDYPRQQVANSFDLMQYHHQKGDRLRREDDRYLFLEALLAAQQNLYISYVGQSIIDNRQLEPSVLVNQLLDYLYDNLDSLPEVENSEYKPMVVYHAMTAFSAKNFSKSHRSFAYEWANLSNTETNEIADFIQPRIEQQNDSESIEIDCEQLIKFIQNPVKYFFEQRLGVYFNKSEQLIADTENFELAGLDLYLIEQQLLQQDEQLLAQYMQQLEIKGVLPYGKFSQIYQDKVRSEIQPFYKELSPYLTAKPHSEKVSLDFCIQGKNVYLKGHLGHLFKLENQRDFTRVVWTVGKHKEKNWIENWLYFLIQRVINKDSLAPIFYAKDGKDNRLVAKTFVVEADFDAQALLSIYLEAYIKAEQQMVLAITQNIKTYLGQIDDMEMNLATLEQIAYGDDNNHMKADIYWQRILKQTANLEDYLGEINQTTESWFTTMLESLDDL